MSDKNTDIKETITQMVLNTAGSYRGKKSSGTVIATIVRDIPIITVAPFSL